MFDSVKMQIKETIKELEANAAGGDADAQHNLFTLLFAEAMENYDIDIFNQAESYLIESAENGWPEAINDLMDQELRRCAFERRVARKNSI